MLKINEPNYLFTSVKHLTTYQLEYATLNLGSCLY